MKQEGLKPGPKIYATLITGCTKMDFFTSGFKLLREMKENGFILFFIFKTLFSLFSKKTYLIIRNSCPSTS